MQRSRLAITGLCAAVLAAALGTPALADEVKLKAAAFLPARVIFAKYFHDWVGEVNKQCAGKVAISVVGPEAIKSLEQWSALKTGVVDMHYGPPNYYKGALVEADVTSLANVETAEQRANGAWAIVNELHNEKLNAWYLTNIFNGVQFYLYTSKPAVGGRFEGFRLRSVPIYDKFFKHYGANPVRMPPPAVRTALERNTVDGYGWPLWGVNDFGWDAYTKYRHGPGFFSANINILVNLDRWKSLADDQRQCLTDMTLWLEEMWPKWREGEDANQTAAQEKSGIQYVDMGPDFAAKAHELHWDELMKANPEVIGKLRPLLVK